MSKFMFNVGQDSFSSGLNTVSGAVSAKNTIPVLSGICIGTRDGKLQLRATDMEMELMTTVDAQVAGAGSIVLPAKYLIDLIKRLPFGTVTVEVDLKNFTAEVKCGKSKYVIHGFGADQFPAEKDIEGYTILKLKQTVIKELARRTTFAAGKDESKPWLTGVLLALQEKTLTGLATDGVRIAHTKYTVENPDERAFKVIVPAGSISEAAKVCKGGDDETATLAVSENRIVVITDKVTIGSRLLEGQYPDVMRLVPQNYPQKLAVNKAEVLESLDRAALVAKDNAVKLGVGTEKLTITSGTPEVGQTYEELVTKLEGEALDIGFNARYLVEGLKAIHAPELKAEPKAEGEELTAIHNVLLEMTGPRNPARLRGLVDDSFSYVVLPLITY